VQVEPRVETRTQQRYLAIRGSVPMDDIPSIADRFGELFSLLAQQGISPAAAPFLRYLRIDMERELTIDAGVPVDVEVSLDGAAADVLTDVLPAGHYATVDHIGPYDRLVQATADLLDWAADNDIALDVQESPLGDLWTSRLEIYQTDPSEEPDPQHWRTTLAFRLAD
jgi:effector-binding domain-containing protein